MEFEFKLKPKALEAKKMIIYKIFQGLFILKYFPSIKLTQFSLIIRILDNKIKKEDIEKIKKEDILDYNSFKVADLLLGHKFITIKRNNLNLTNLGKEKLEKILSLNVFENIKEELENLIKYKKLLKKYSQLKG